MSAFKAITWTRERVAELRAAYDRAYADFQTSFKVKITGQGEHEFDTRYAKYLLEYLDGEFKTNPDQPREPYHEGKEGE